MNSNEPVWTLLDDIMLEYKESHPECVIESDVECPDYELNLPPIITSNLIMIIREIMENAFKHSKPIELLSRYISAAGLLMSLSMTTVLVLTVISVMLHLGIAVLTASGKLFICWVDNLK